MVKFLKSRDIQKEKSNSVTELEKIRELEKEKSINQRIESLIFQKFKEVGLEEKINDMALQLDEMAEKMEDLLYAYNSNCRQNSSPSARKRKVKEMIKLLLDQHGNLSAPQLSKLLKLSRTRCSEYLNEMEKNDILVAELKCRKKLYSIRQ